MQLRWLRAPGPIHRAAGVTYQPPPFRSYATWNVARLLLIEDEPSIADTLVFALESDGNRVRWEKLGHAGLSAAQAEEFDLVILDVGLPDVSGFEVCRALRKTSETPVLFLTARGDEIDRIVGLEIGADDYVVKPFSPREIAARVRVILRRARGRTTATVTELATTRDTPGADDAEFIVDRERISITYRGTSLALTAQEFRLLEHLVGHPDRVFSRGELLAAVGAETDPVYERNIDTHVKSLRSKLRAVASDDDPLVTHRGFGYSYRPRGS